MKAWIAPILLACLLAACASTPQRPAVEHDLALARQALDRAATDNVADYADQTLAKARKDYAKAQKALAAGLFDSARDAASTARLEAELAEAQARAARARANKLQMQRDIERMKNAAKLPGDE
jgi:hypothetical protein